MRAEAELRDLLCDYSSIGVLIDDHVPEGAAMVLTADERAQLAEHVLEDEPLPEGVVMVHDQSQVNAISMFCDSTGATFATIHVEMPA